MSEKRDDGLSAFDGFTRRAAAAGMFNEDQRDYMRSLSAMPPEAKCKCGWYAKRTCYHCNHDEMKALGVTMVYKSHFTREQDYVLPDGRRVDYSGAVAWLREQP